MTQPIEVLVGFLVDFEMLVPDVCLGVLGVELGGGFLYGCWFWQGLGIGGVAVTTVSFREIFLSTDSVCHVWV